MTRRRAGHDRRKDRSRSAGNAGHDAGITGHDNPESLVTLSRNTHRDIVRLEKGVEAYRFVMLFDRAWLDVVLPPLTRQAIADRRAAAFVDSHDARAATLVRRKHERLIDLYPEKKISRSLLLNNVRCETRWPRNRDFPLTEQALAECADTHESWANRQVDMLVPEIARWSTKTPFSRRETFEGLAGGKLTEKIRNARKWLHQHAPR